MGEAEEGEMSMNRFCEITVEEALRLREAGAAAEVVAATVGPAQSADTLRTALAMGSDRAVHVHHDPDPARLLLPLAGAKILRAVALQEKPGLVILGKQGHTPRSPATFSTASPSRFAATGHQGQPYSHPSVSLPGSNFVASSPSPAASGGSSSVFRDYHPRNTT